MWGLSPFGASWRSKPASLIPSRGLRRSVGVSRRCFLMLRRKFLESPGGIISVPNALGIHPSEFFTHAAIEHSFECFFLSCRFQETGRRVARLIVRLQRFLPAGESHDERSCYSSPVRSSSPGFLISRVFSPRPLPESSSRLLPCRFPPPRPPKGRTFDRANRLRSFPSTAHQHFTLPSALTRLIFFTDSTVSHGRLPRP